MLSAGGSDCLPIRSNVKCLFGGVSYLLHLYTGGIIKGVSSSLHFTWLLVSESLVIYSNIYILLFV
ncbi:hypothetical protein LguiA_008387 [Lonicera macranthoides]